MKTELESMKPWKRWVAAAGFFTATALALYSAKCEETKPAGKPEQRQVQTTNSLDYKTTNFTNDTEQVLLARMLFGEARNCTDEEKIAVAYTAVNRARDKKKWNGETVREAILKPWQYSCLNNNDPNKSKLMNPMSYDPKSFERCLTISSNVLASKYEDLSKGATHYFNPNIVTPSWATNMIKIGHIPTSKGLSRHEFYK